MQKQAVFIFGAPGSGKGTQANLLSWTKGFYHFDSGKLLRGVLHDPANQNKKIVQRERKLNDGGILNTPSWVLGIFKKESRKIAKAGLSIAYSGSPRTLYEAFGDSKTIGLVAFLEKIYGKEHIHTFILNVNPEVAAGRNKIRRLCTTCGNAVLGDAPVTKCPVCEGELKTRVDDDPEKYKIRIREYNERTVPILNELKRQGFSVIEINGEQKPPVIFAEILKYL